MSVLTTEELERRIANLEAERRELLAALSNLSKASAAVLKVVSVRIDDPRIEQFDALRAAVLKAGCTE